MQETYITGANSFVGKRLVKELGDVVRVPHKYIHKTDFSPATRVFFLSTYGNLAHHDDIGEIVKANVTDLAHTLETIDWDNIESFVFFSTSSVKLRIQTAYSRTKKAAEELLLAYMEKYDAPITIIRPLSITGVGEQPEHLIPVLIDSIENDKPINLVPYATHDFIDIDDVVAGTINLSSNRARGIFELGRGSSYTNLQILRIVERLLGKQAQVNFVDSMRPYDNEEWISTNFKSRGWGWSPKKSPEDSIREMIYVK